MRLLKKILLGFLLLAALLAAIHIAGLAVYLRAFDRLKAPRIETAEWGFPYERIEFPSLDGTRLVGWLFKPKQEGAGAVVMMNGLGGRKSARNMTTVGKAFLDAGIIVLSFDARGQGESEGRTTLGLREPSDVKAAALLLRERTGRGRTGALGFSLGGASVLIAAGEGGEIDAAAAQAPFGNLSRAIGCYLDFHYDRLRRKHAAWLPGRYPFPHVLSELTFDLRFFTRASSISPEESVMKAAPKPIMIIHGTEDAKIRLDCAVNSGKAEGLPPNVEYVLVPGAGHDFPINDAGLIAKIVDFFRMAFSPEAPR